jgi:hypothetical protein
MPLTVQQLLETLHRMRPNMALITSDFSSLPDVTISGARAPIVASKVFSCISSCIAQKSLPSIVCVYAVDSKLALIWRTFGPFYIDIGRERRTFFLLYTINLSCRKMAKRRTIPVIWRLWYTPLFFTLFLARTNQAFFILEKCSHLYVCKSFGKGPQSLQTLEA